MSISDVSALVFQSGHGHPIAFEVYQDTHPIALFCVGAAAVIALLWGLAEILD
jgi:hypothetical protein